MDRREYIMLFSVALGWALFFGGLDDVPGCRDLGEASLPERSQCSPYWLSDGAKAGAASAGPLRRRTAGFDADLAHL